MEFKHAIIKKMYIEEIFILSRYLNCQLLAFAVIQSNKMH
jgi:hypothetical protein